MEQDIKIYNSDRKEELELSEMERKSIIKSDIIT